MSSKVAKKLIGIFIEDDRRPKPPIIQWIQNECRKGTLRPLVDEFVKKQEEPLDPDLLLVESVSEETIVCRIPCKLFDSESPSAFSTEVKFKLEPVQWMAQRLEMPPKLP